MKRRTVLHLAGATLVMPEWAFAQAPKTYRLGYLSTADEATTRPSIESLLAGMRERGYVVGKNLVVDVRYTRGDATRLPALTDELIALKPDALAGIDSACRVMAVRTQRIPIVILASSDPVASGLVKSLARPGTNLTGMSTQGRALLAKQVELLTEILPKMSRLGFLSDLTYAGREEHERVVQEAARTKGLTLVVVGARNTESAGQAFDDFKNQRAEAIVVAGTGPMFFWRKAIVDGAARSRLPTAYSGAQYVESGGLFSYGTNFLESLRDEVSEVVDLIFKGANPAELAVRQSSRFELVVNLKTARDIGVTFPPAVLLRADRVIE